MTKQDCTNCGAAIGDGDYVSGHRLCAVCRRGRTRASQLVIRCVKCHEPLDTNDPAITTLGPRCRRCW